MNPLPTKKQFGPVCYRFNPAWSLLHHKVIKINGLTLFSLVVLFTTLHSASLQLIIPTPIETKLAAPTPVSQEQAKQNYGQLPISFEVNQGQSDSGVRYQSQGAGYTLFLTNQEIVLNLTNQASPSKDTVINENTPQPMSQPFTQAASASKYSSGTSLRMKWLGGNDNPLVSGLDKQAGVTNYLFGNDPSKWQTGIANYAKVDYQQVYPGIDLTFYGNRQQLEYDFRLQPQTDPGLIRLSFEGASGLELTEAGELVVHTANGDMVQPAPYIYQDSNGIRQKVKGSFKLLTSPTGALPVVGFEVSSYDPIRPLIIDPVLVYSTYLGGSASDNPGGMAVDSSGNAYLTGTASSTNFPVTAGAYQTTCGCNNSDAFVTKLNATGTALVYSTYLGGSSTDEGNAIAVDSTGDAYITGYTLSANFPVTSGAFQTTLNGGNDAFVTKLNATGTALVYSTFLGGGGLDAQDLSRVIAVDGSGNAFVTGTTQSATFPVTSGAFQTTFVGSVDAFVAKFNPAGTSLIYSTFLHDDTYAYQIAMDSSGNAFIAGSTSSTTFPATAGAYQTTLKGVGDGFVTKLNATGTTLI